MSSSRRRRRPETGYGRRTLDEGRCSDGLTTEERQELVRLRGENRALREEREILKKAAAWFVRETDSKRGKDSSS